MAFVRSYATLYDKILTDTMQYIDTDKINRFKLKRSDIQSDNLIYASAAASSAPITLVYTPAGSGKSALIKDRVKALKNIGLKGEEIIVLNMNIAKSKQMAIDIPDVNVMTFSDFTHNIFNANYPDCQLSDMNSIVNTLRLQPQTTLLADFINKMSMINQQDRATVLTLFTNAHLDFVIDTLLSINKADYALESMICQNKIYTFAKNPYSAKAILVNGVHNMPLPILCAILAYVNRYHCNLFMTGSPDETIYDFNMAYNNAMNVISAYAESKHIDIIRLTDSSIIDDNIRNVLDMKNGVVIENVTKTDINVTHEMELQSVIRSAFTTDNNYLKDKLNKHESVLIIARSKSELTEIKQVITDYYKPLYPDINILDLTTIQPNSTTYGEIASKYANGLIVKYPNGLTITQFFYELYNCMAYEIGSTGVPNTKNQCVTDKDNIMEFFTKYRHAFPEDNVVCDVKTIIQTIIDIESDAIQQYMQSVNENSDMNFHGADIILSTIHTAIDIRTNNVIVFFRNFNDRIDKNLYRVALSRANKSEHIIFANYGIFEVPHQTYLKLHIK